MHTLLLACLACLARGAQDPSLTVDKVRHDLGRLPSWQKVQVQVRVGNEGAGRLVLNEVETSCGCTTAVTARRVLGPGEYLIVEVTLDPAREQGHVHKTLTLHSNDPRQPRVEVVLEGEVVPPLQANPDLASFREVLPGDVRVQRVRLLSPAGGRPRLERGADLPPFLSVEVVDTGAELQAAVTLTGSHLPPGQASGEVLVPFATGIPEAPRWLLPVLWSTGKPLRVQPGRMVFEPGPRTETQTLPFTLQEARGRPFRILGLRNPSPPFLVEGPPTAAASRHALVLRPPPQDPPGPRGATLLLTTDHPDHPEVAVNVMANLR